jgi:hypothetical protein
MRSGNAAQGGAQAPCAQKGLERKWPRIARPLPRTRNPSRKPVRRTFIIYLCSISQARAVGQAPGPNFGRKPAKKPRNTKISYPPYWPLSSLLALLEPKRRLRLRPKSGAKLAATIWSTMAAGSRAVDTCSTHLEPHAQHKEEMTWTMFAVLTLGLIVAAALMGYGLLSLALDAMNFSGRRQQDSDCWCWWLFVTWRPR